MCTLGLVLYSHIFSSSCNFGCSKGGSKSAQVLLNGIGAVMVLTFDKSEIATPVNSQIHALFGVFSVLYAPPAFLPPQGH